MRTSCGKTRSGQARRLPRRFVAVGDLPSPDQELSGEHGRGIDADFGGRQSRPLVEQVTPDPRAITVHEHFSFIQAPPVGFRERAYDPRSSFFGISYMDFATPVDQPIVKRYIDHFRLTKEDPSAPISEPVKPIVTTWTALFPNRFVPPFSKGLRGGIKLHRRGYKDAFQVKLLPEGVDAMDVRYNVIEWVPRATRAGLRQHHRRSAHGRDRQRHVNFDALRIRQVF